MKRKHLDAGLQQLSHEGVINYFIERNGKNRPLSRSFRWYSTV